MHRQPGTLHYFIICSIFLLISECVWRPFGDSLWNITCVYGKGLWVRNPIEKISRGISMAKPSRRECLPSEDSTSQAPRRVLTVATRQCRMQLAALFVVSLVITPFEAAYSNSTALPCDGNATLIQTCGWFVLNCTFKELPNATLVVSAPRSCNASVNATRIVLDVWLSTLFQISVVVENSTTAPQGVDVWIGIHGGWGDKMLTCNTSTFLPIVTIGMGASNSSGMPAAALAASTVSVVVGSDTMLFARNRDALLAVQGTMLPGLTVELVFAEGAIVVLEDLRSVLSFDRFVAPDAHVRFTLSNATLTLTQTSSAAHLVTSVVFLPPLSTPNGGMMLGTVTLALEDRSLVSIVGAPRASLVLVNVSTSSQHDGAFSLFANLNVSVASNSVVMLSFRCINVLANFAVMVRNVSLSVVDSLVSCVDSPVDFTDQGVALLAIQSIAAPVSLADLSLTVERSIVTFGSNWTYTDLVYLGELTANFSITNVSIVLCNRTTVVLGGRSGAVCRGRSEEVGIASWVSVDVCSNSTISATNEGYLTIFRSNLLLGSALRVSMSQGSSLVVHGFTGSIMHFIAMSLIVTDATITMAVQCVAHFYNTGAAIVGSGLNDTNFALVTIALCESSFIVDGGDEAVCVLIYLYAKIGSLVSHGTFIHIESESLVQCNAPGYLLSALGNVTTRVSAIQVRIANSFVTTHNTRTVLISCESLNQSALVSHAEITVSNFSAIQLASQVSSFFVKATAPLGSYVNNVTIVSCSSVVLLGVGTFVVATSPFGTVAVSSIQCSFRNQSVTQFSSTGYVVYLYGNPASDLMLSNVSIDIHGSYIKVQGSMGNVVGTHGGGRIAVRNITVDFCASTFWCSRKGFVVFVTDETNGSYAVNDISVRFREGSVMSVGAVLGALCYLSSSESAEGNISFSNLRVVVSSSNVTYAAKGFLVVVESTLGIELTGISVVLARQSKVVFGEGALIGALWSDESRANASSLVVAISGGVVVEFVKNGYLIMTRGCSIVHDITVAIKQGSTVMFHGGEAGLCFSTSVFDVTVSMVWLEVDSSVVIATSGIAFGVYAAGGDVSAPIVSTTLKDVTIVISGQSSFETSGNRSALCAVDGVSSTITHDLNITVTGKSFISFPNGNGFLALVKLGACSRASINVMNGSALLVSSVMYCNGLVSLLSLQIHASRIFHTEFLLQVISDALTVAIVEALVMLLAESALPGSQPYFQLRLPSRIVQLSVTADCSVVGRFTRPGNNNVVRVQRMRALRRQDVMMGGALAPNARVTAANCDGWRGSNEFMPSPSVSITASIPLPSPTGSLTAATCTMPVSPSQQPFAIAARDARTLARGSVPVVVLLLGASSVAVCHVGSVAPGIQIISQRSAAWELCAQHAQQSQDSGDVDSHPVGDVASNPFDLVVPGLGDDLQYAGGSVASCIILALGMGVLCSGASLCHNRSALAKLRSMSVTAVVEAAHLPGTLYFPWTMVIQPLTAASVAMIASPSRSAASVVLGAFVLILFVALPGLFATVVIRRNIRALGIQCIPTILRHDDERSRVVHIMRLLFNDRYQWVSICSQAENARRFLKHFEVVISSYRRGREWFLCIEVLLPLVSGLLDGASASLSSTVACSPAALRGFDMTQLALLVTVAGTVAVLRPYNNVFNDALCITTLLLSSLALCILQWGDGGIAVAWLSGVASILGLLPLFWQLGFAVLSNVTAPHRALRAERQPDVQKIERMAVFAPIDKRAGNSNSFGTDPGSGGRQSVTARRVASVENLAAVIRLICERNAALRGEPDGAR